MSVRDTSREAYAEIQPLSDRQAAVLVVLEHSAPLTNNEIARELGWPINTVTPRVFELRARGNVKELGKRTCRVTGRNAYQWGVGEARPVKEKLVPKRVLVNGIWKVRLVPLASEGGAAIVQQTGDEHGHSVVANWAI